MDDEDEPWHGIKDPELLQDLIADAQSMDYDDFRDTHSSLLNDPYEFWENYHDGLAEGVIDAVKGAVKKGLEKLGHGSDEEMIKDLQKKTGVPATGQKPEPKDDKKMQESLMKEFANFKI